MSGAPTLVHFTDDEIVTIVDSFWKAELLHYCFQGLHAEAMVEQLQFGDDATRDHILACQECRATFIKHLEHRAMIVELTSSKVVGLNVKMPTGRFQTYR